MTIERGRTWGTVGPLPAEVVRVADDARARAVVERAWRNGEDPPPLLLTGGDLWQTCGGTSVPARASGDHPHLPVDVGLVEVDDAEHLFVAHLVLRGPTAWFGDVVAVMNAQHLGRWDVAPRSHPNDGRLDLVDARRLGLQDRWKAWRRLPAGSHVPHPGIAQRRVDRAVVELDRPRRVILDGEAVAAARRVVVRCLPDMITVCL